MRRVNLYKGRGVTITQTATATVGTGIAVAFNAANVFRGKGRVNG